MSSHVPSNQNETWTDEKHVHYLNSMETWFVRTMLENKDRYNNNLRLDRHVPDSFESTLDCKQKRTRKMLANSDFIGTTTGRGRPHRSSRRSSSHQSQPHDSSRDQVVPQIEK